MTCSDHNEELYSVHTLLIMVEVWLILMDKEHVRVTCQSNMGLNDFSVKYGEAMPSPNEDSTWRFGGEGRQCYTFRPYKLGLIYIIIPFHTSSLYSVHACSKMACLNCE